MAGKISRAPAVVIRPPFELMRPRPAAVLPPEDAFPGGVLYEVKLDGVRSAAWRGDGDVQLWSRQGNQLSDRYPELLPALRAVVKPGVTLDGEICAWSGGRIDFRQLLRSPARRRAEGVALSYVAWDVLSRPGEDLRDLPLAVRRGILVGLLADAGAQVQPVMATQDREQALAWFEGLVQAGVEGVVGKALAGRYAPATPARVSWVKVRHRTTTDGLLLGVAGSARRPDAVLVQLPDGRRELTSPRLTAAQAGQVAEAITGLLRPPESGACWLTEPYPVAEVLVGTGRHATVRFVRMRPPE
ncbi:DNA ligase [Kitasatospora sp. NPDC086791]|uniref:ATP-dependent DNA ligase n=1 Tax=Kitasatospora sp. NPDC086791 TaxID=3155178 RepID=UPI0034165670